MAREGSTGSVLIALALINFFQMLFLFLTLEIIPDPSLSQRLAQIREFQVRGREGKFSAHYWG